MRLCPRRHTFRKQDVLHCHAELSARLGPEGMEGFVFAYDCKPNRLLRVWIPSEELLHVVPSAWILVAATSVSHTCFCWSILLEHLKRIAHGASMHNTPFPASLIPSTLAWYGMYTLLPNHYREDNWFVKKEA